VDPVEYRERLLAPLRSTARREPGPLPVLPPSIWFAPRDAPRIGLEDLYRAGVRWGHAGRRRQLEAQLAGHDRALDDALQGLRGYQDALIRTQAELDQASRVFNRHERELQDEVNAARGRIAELENSTFWRATAPLRWSVHLAKRLGRRALQLPRRWRSLRPRLATARQIARQEGVGELARRLAQKAVRAPRSAALRERSGLAAAIASLDLPTSAEPRVSVIVPVHGEHLYTFSCLASLREEAAAIPLEVIVADDASPEPAAEALAEVTGVRFERNAVNLGFLRNCNRAAALARGEFLLFLNNDTVVTPGAVAALLAIFEHFPEAGAAGAKLVYPDGRLQEAGAIVWRDGSAWNYGRGDDPDKPEYNYVRVVDYCSAAALMVPRELFLSAGGFDERYVPAYCEDTDLCLRLRAAGRPVYYQPAAEVVHFEGVSHGTDTGAGIKARQIENQERLRERWHETLADHRPNGMLPMLERDRGVRRRALLVEACMLTPDQDSGSLRTLRMLRILRDMGCGVTFVAANLEDRQPYVDELRQAGVEVLHAPYVRSIDEVLRERGGEFDVVILARYYVAGPHIEAVRRYAPRALLVFDTIDLHYLRSRRLAELERDAKLAQAAEAIYREELDCVRRCDVTWVVSDVEQQILSREIPNARVLVLSNIHEPVDCVPSFAAREGLLFVGGFRHPPNVDAAMYLVRELVPRWRERLPGVKMYIAGSSPPKAIRELAGEGIEVLGFVPRLEPWLARCRVSVSPLRYGAGVKGKVNQAMAHGLPVVASSMSVEGMHVAEGEAVLLADDPDAFADGVVRLYNDEALWNRLSRAGQVNIERHFSAAVARRMLRELFAMVDARAT